MREIGDGRQIGRQRLVTFLLDLFLHELNDLDLFFRLVDWDLHTW